MPHSNWKRDRAGKYVRFRRVNGELHIDLVMKLGTGMWISTTGVKGDENRRGGNKQFKTRMAATSALDNWIANPPAPKPEPKKAEPEFVDHHHGENTECDGCGGSGKYYGHGYVENGVFKGFVGKCYRCGGKGFQDDEDRKRNWGYDNFHRRIEA